jgi:5'-phosphate synthase pdxT subunit
VSTRRNAFGRQLASFEADLAIDALGGEPLHAVFIRAPWIEDHGGGVEVLAEVEGRPVAVRQGSVVAVAFHPELAGEDRLHVWLLEQAADRSVPAARPDIRRVA